MLVLAFDTTLGACSAALFDSGRGHLLAHAYEPLERGHAERLVGMVQDVLSRASTELSELDRLAVTVGPGTFTGVRIGLSLARGLKLALGLPVCGLTTLEAIRLNVRENPEHRPIAALIDARRGEFYLAAWSADGAEMVAPCAVRHEEAMALLPPGSLAVGTGADRLLDLAAGSRGLRRAPVPDLPDAAYIAAAAAGMMPGALPPRPVYLRPPGATLPVNAAGHIAIIEATVEHAGVLSALHTECFEEEWPAADIARLMALPGAIGLLAFIAPELERPAGFVLARRAADEAEIVAIGVAPGFRRRGVARRLVGRLADALTVAGTASLFIEVATHNEAAKSLYGALGFTQAGVRKGYYARRQGGSEDALVMRLAL